MLITNNNYALHDINQPHRTLASVMYLFGVNLAKHESVIKNDLARLGELLANMDYFAVTIHFIPFLSDFVRFHRMFYLFLIPPATSLFRAKL